MFEKWETEIEEEFEGRLKAAVRATTTASRKKNKFKVLDEIREMTEPAATCRNLVWRKDLRKKRLGRQHENSTPGWELFPRERQFKDPW